MDVSYVISATFGSLGFSDGVSNTLIRAFDLATSAAAADADDDDDDDELFLQYDWPKIGV